MRKEMTATEELEYIIAIIARQFYTNADKDVFLSVNGLCFSEEMRRSLNEDRGLWVRVSAEHWKNLSMYLVDKFLHSFYNTNQYINFEVRDYIEIHKLYDELFADICEKNTVQEIELRHYERFRGLVARLQPVLYADCLIGKMNRYVCSEYSAKFQLELLGVEPCELKEPILDIGCGEHGYLVAELQGRGIDAYGLDRLCQNRVGLIECSWFDFDFGEKKWGTVLSNLSFSSHYINHMINNSADVEKFSRVYDNILNSLKAGGVWYYAPAMPQAEAMISDEFIVDHTKIDNVFLKTMIRRKGDN